MFLIIKNSISAVILCIFVSFTSITMLRISRGKRMALLAVGELNNSDENEPLNQIVDKITFQKKGTTKNLNTDNIVVEINIDGNVGYNDQTNNISGYSSVLLAIPEFPSREIFKRYYFLQ
uniref:Uncharacterized protein LOC114334363 n=1 Tax=Diabrotica virgifera virgifera TaxID=50390 RepID=A0A6P7G5I7_DIAVI